LRYTTPTCAIDIHQAKPERW